MYTSLIEPDFGHPRRRPRPLVPRRTGLRTTRPHPPRLQCLSPTGGAADRNASTAPPNKPTPASRSWSQASDSPTASATCASAGSSTATCPGSKTDTRPDSGFDDVVGEGPPASRDGPETRRRNAPRTARSLNRPGFRAGRVTCDHRSGWRCRTGPRTARQGTARARGSRPPRMSSAEPSPCSNEPSCEVAVSGSGGGRTRSLS